MRSLLNRLRGKLETTVWLVPAAFIAGAIGLSLGAERIDRSLPRGFSAWFLFRGGPEGARSVLSVVAQSMMTLSGVVFSVTVLVLQLASSQFSPRVLRNFLRDRGTQSAMGVFVGTFLYSLLGLRSVRGSTSSTDGYVPSLTVWFSVVLAAACVGMFIYFIHHISQSIRAAQVLQRIGDDAREHLDRLYPEGVGHDAKDQDRRWRSGKPSKVVSLSGKSGVLMAVDEEGLWECVCAAEVTVALLPMVGDFIAHGTAVFAIWGNPASVDEESLLDTLTTGLERDVRQDLSFALRELVDVAERALSPGVNDPTTAVQAIDQLHDILRRLVQRRFPAPYRLDDEGLLRLMLPRPDWDAYVTLAVDEIRHCGAGALQVTRRLRFMLEDLLSVAPRFRRAPLERELHLLHTRVDRAFDVRADERAADTPSAQGHGPARIDGLAQPGEDADAGALRANAPDGSADPPAGERPDR